MPVSIEPLSPSLPFGVVIKGLDRASIRDEDTRQSIVSAWQRAGLIVFSECEASQDFHIALSKAFGTLEIHKTKEYLDASTPELVTLTTTGDTEFEFESEVGEVFGWHRDLIYTLAINRGGILRSLRPSRRGGLTGFLDSADAYDRLPDRLKAELEGLRAIYQIGSHEEFPFATRSPVKLIKRSSQLQSIMERRERDFPRVSHPLVFTHPESGRKILNFSPFFFVRIEDLPEQASDDMLLSLSSHLFDCPSYHHKWATDELVLWDNWRILHMVGFTPRGEERIMQRTTIAGDYGLGRLAAAQQGRA